MDTFGYQPRSFLAFLQFRCKSKGIVGLFLLKFIFKGFFEPFTIKLHNFLIDTALPDPQLYIS